MNQGKLTVITGPMFSGKTSLLIRKINAVKSLNIPFLILKPSIDIRYHKDSIVSHKGVTEKSRLAEVDQVFSFEGFEEVFIDEIQFFTPKFIDSIIHYLQKGVNFTLCGLEKDYLGNEFGSVPKLKEISNEYILLEGDCSICNKPSTNTFRKTKSTNIIMVGSSDEYSSLCKTCYDTETQKI